MTELEQLKSEFQNLNYHLGELYESRESNIPIPCNADLIIQRHVRDLGEDPNSYIEQVGGEQEIINNI